MISYDIEPICIDRKMHAKAVRIEGEILALLRLAQPWHTCRSNAFAVHSSLAANSLNCKHNMGENLSAQIQVTPPRQIADIFTCWQPISDDSTPNILLSCLNESWGWNTGCIILGFLDFCFSRKVRISEQRCFAFHGGHHCYQNVIRVRPPLRQVLWYGTPIAQRGYLPNQWFQMLLLRC